MAVCRGGTAAGRNPSPSGRAGGRGHRAGTQTTGQDRPGLEMRTTLELFKDLHEEHTAWVQRLHATLFHQGVPAVAGDVLASAQRHQLETGAGLSPAAHQAVMTTLRVLDRLDAELVVLRRQITTFARRQPGCRALQQQHGVGPITAAAIWAQLGDTRRFPPPARPSATLGWMSPSTHPTANAPLATSPGRDRRPAVGIIRGRQMRGPTLQPGLRLLHAGQRPLW